jgi:hypothetical protein
VIARSTPAKQDMSGSKQLILRDMRQVLSRCIRSYCVDWRRAQQTVIDKRRKNSNLVEVKVN